MDNIIEFNIGCRRCNHLQNIGNGTFMCNMVDYADGTSIYPIEDGERTEDWGACNGKYREVTRTRGRKGKGAV